MWRSIKLFIMSIGVVLAGACANNEQDSEGTGEPDISLPGEASVEGNALAPFLDDPASPSANCSVVQYCNAPGNEGSVCKQLGCSTSAALLECFTEVRNVCGTHTCPLIFVDLNGRRINQCATGCGLDSNIAAPIPCALPSK